ncbi:HlyC/CorC family transporter [candidate division TA06 bacterium]|uniref:HlyC/CorC family transporter n=1 Tax=candidate division TA06 bacterium TaxID=2250710 RepID=A0A523UYN6_UNCT6|nr:MAG: HlyC/CorC family transporter [candidate division TA06 bacterium]
MMGAIIAIFFLLMVGFFGASEMALISANRVRLRHLRKLGSRGARNALDLLAKPEIFLTTILVGTNLSVVACTFLATRLLYLRFGEPGRLASPFIVGFAILILGEMIPKSFARVRPERVGISVSPAIVSARKVLFPLIVLSNWGARALLFLFRFSPKEVIPIFSRGTFESAIEAGEDEGLLGARDRRIISTVLDFWRKPIREIMVPRMEMVVSPVDVSYEEIARLLADTGHSRIPVYEGNVDNIKGVVVAVDLLEKEGWDAKKVMRSVTFVPEEKSCASLLDELKKDYTHMAIVVDEYGGTSGLVGLEDLVEELIGEIRDEHDKELRRFRKVARRTILADGSARIADIEKHFHINLPKGEYETIGGLLIESAGKIPKVGRIFKFGQVTVVVLDSSDRKVDKVRIRVS